MAHLTYTIDEAGKPQYWRVERGTELLEAFGLTVGELSSWHAAMFGQGRLWEVPRRLFAVHLALGARVEDMVPQSVLEIAAACSRPNEAPVTEKEVPAILERAVTFWKRQKGRQEVGSWKSEVGSRKFDEKYGAPLLDDRGRAVEMLRRFGVKEEDPEVWEYMIMRAGQLESQLESDDDRQTALQMLRNEETLIYSSNRQLDMVQRRIRSIVDAGPDGKIKPQDKEDYGDLRGLQLREDELIKSSAALQKAIEEAKEKLALGESVTGATRHTEQVRDLVSDIDRSYREWYADENNALKEGFLTKAQVEIVTRGFADRPEQYSRVFPIVLLIPQLIAGLYDPNFEMPALGRNHRSTVRRLQAGMRGALEREQAAQEGTLDSLQDEIEEAEPPAPVAVGEMAQAGAPMPPMPPVPVDEEPEGEGSPFA